MNMNQPTDAFMQDIQRLRDDYEAKRAQSNLVSRQTIDLALGLIDGVYCYTYWHEDQCIRLADIPNTLSGDILRLKQNLPNAVNHGNHEIIGNQVRPFECPPLPEEDEDDSEDLNPILASLPLIDVNTKHFVKQGKYKTEIENLLKCQGGTCPGVPKSAHIIPLLGKSPEGGLVFERFKPRYILAFIYPLAIYKDWILQIISGIKCLHSQGIIHRDLRIDNLVFSGFRVLICDLESRWGNRLAPEISRDQVVDAGWTEKSDIYDLGYLIKGMIYGNAPVTFAVEWDVPRPLDAVVEACTRERPEERPSLDDIYAMVEGIEVSVEGSLV
ncbi:unnamed protein product [Penicillium olsonii]|nr:unnamed protein product [Penicillium olsonii]CAG7928106.1 unnamed protein product [Penicillium olsonii]